MAVAVVRSKQTGGAVAHSTLTFAASPAAGNYLFAFITQTGEAVVKPTIKDNLGSTGWHVMTTNAEDAGANIGVWCWKKAVGTETKIEATPASPGVIQGIGYCEVSGVSEEIDTEVASNEHASAKTVTSGEVTASAGDLILAGVCGVSGSFGLISAWTSGGTGTGAMTTFENEEAGAERTICGYYLPAGAVKGTFTANWATGRTSGILVVAFKAAATTKTGTQSQNLALQQAAAGQKNAPGAPQQNLALRQAQAGQKVSRGTQGQAVAFLQSVAGRKVSPGVVAESAAFLQVVSGRKVARGELTQRAALPQQLQGQKLGQGAVTQALALVQAAKAQRIAQGSQTQRMALVQAHGAQKVAQGAQAQRLALTGSQAGQKVAKGAVVQFLALAQSYVIIHLKASEGVATASVSLPFTATPSVAVQESAEGSVGTVQRAEGKVGQ